jgi:hypothetical protein
MFRRIPAINRPGLYRCSNARMCQRGQLHLSNQALRNPNDSSDQIVYTTMARLHKRAAIDFQTASPANIMDWCGAVRQRSRVAWPFDRDVGGLRWVFDFA